MSLSGDSVSDCTYVFEELFLSGVSVSDCRSLFVCLRCFCFKVVCVEGCLCA